MKIYSIDLDRDHAKALREKFHVETIPTLLFFSNEYELDDTDGVNTIRGMYHQALRQWCKEKHFFGTREGEYIWHGIICHQCNMCPIIGARHGCIDPKCYVDYCETCLPTIKHEHPLVEYLIPKQPYSFEQIFKSVPYLLGRLFGKNDVELYIFLLLLIHPHSI